LPLLAKNAKANGFLVIHDALKNDSEKMKIKNFGDASLFKEEIKEIKDYKNQPRNFKSVYYVLRKGL
jgi:hypothetical protein